MWFKADDNLDDSPEVLSIPPRYRASALGVFLLCGTYVSRQLSDGFVPDEIIRKKGGTDTLKGWLVRAGLWELADGGARFTGRGCRVPTAQAVRNERVATAQRVRNHRVAKQNGVDLGQPLDVTPLRGEGVTPSHGVGVGNGVSNSLTSKAVVTLVGDVTSDETFELATAERGRSPAVSVGATRLVATVIGTKVNNADKTILRIKASEMLAQGESEDDVAECLRLWLTKSELGAHGLPLCMAEIYKRKHNGNQLRGAGKKAADWQALKGKYQ